MPLVKPNRQRIKALMIEKGWSQLDLALESGVVRGTIENVLRDPPRTCTQRTLKKIADALGVMVRDIAEPGFFSREKGWVSTWKESADSAGAQGGIAVRAPVRVCGMHLPSMLSEHFMGRDPELGQLTDAWEAPDIHLMSVVGVGGQGKTALVKRWLQASRPDYRGAQKVFVWSFAGQGREYAASGSDEFIAAAWSCFCKGDDMPKNWYRCITALADAIASGRNLLVLDGMEVFQGGADDATGGYLQPDEPLRVLLIRLAEGNGGVCILTSRLPIAELNEYRRSGSAEIDLSGLDPASGRSLLHELGLAESDTELERLAADLWGHPLSLNLLGRYLVDAAVEMDLERLTEHYIPRADARQGQPGERLVAEYEQWLGEGAEISILRLLALFDSRVELGLLEALAGPPVMGALNRDTATRPGEEWMLHLKALRRAGLLNIVEQGRERLLDLHPVVRAHFRRRLQESAPREWRIAQARIYHWLLDRAPTEPVAGADLDPLHRAMRHGFEAGLHEQVFGEVIWKRLLQGYPALALQKFNAGQRDLRAVQAFFGGPRYDPPVLQVGIQDGLVRGRLFWWAGLVLRLHGRAREAVGFFERSRQAFEQSGDELSIPMALGYEASCLLHIGDVNGALELAREAAARLDSTLCSVGHWVRDTGYVVGTIRDAILRIGYIGGKVVPLHLRVGLFELGGVLHAAGRLDEALATFASGLGSPLPPGAREWDLFTVQDGYYLELLLDLGRRDQVRKYVADHWNRGPGTRLTEAMAEIFLARMRIGEQADGAGLRRLAAALENSGDQLDFRTRSHLVRGLLELTRRARELADFGLAGELLERARAVYRSASLDLFEVDCLIEDAWIELNGAQLHGAYSKALRARSLIEQNGYRLQGPGVEDLLAAVDGRAD